MAEYVLSDAATGVMFTFRITVGVSDITPLLNLIIPIHRKIL